MTNHAQIQKVLPEGTNFDNVFFFFFVDEGREDPSITLGETSSDRDDDGPTLNAGLVTTIPDLFSRKAYIFVNFQGGGSRTPVPLWICTC